MIRWENILESPLRFWGSVFRDVDDLIGHKTTGIYGPFEKHEALILGFRLPPKRIIMLHGTGLFEIRKTPTHTIPWIRDFLKKTFD